MNATKPPCKEYERLWEGHCIDKNLADEWLDRLNKLGCFDLISICEGHSDRRPGSASAYPHLNLKLKEHLLPPVSDRWDKYKSVFFDQVNRLFQTGDTLVNMEVKFKLRLGVAKMSYRENLSLKIRCRQARTASKMDPKTATWFRRTVARLEKLDRSIASRISEPVE
ncbi:MAG: hypothetical protein PVG32_00460 [Anaerolineales bacterium]|jgi:hypothetical protein